MNYAIYCTDKPDHLQLRLDNRPAHVEYLNALNAEGKLVLAGPTLGEDNKPTGSIVIVDAESRDAAQRIADNDPYAKAGLFQSVEIRGWNWVFNKPEAQ
ncbi:MAG TPA: YciI-like protein [Tianweitania sediminis]|jgi:hypothetical protein|nr:YciI-like protein [Tianweitania sediminis]